MGGGTTGGSAEVHSGIVTSSGSTYPSSQSGEQSTGDKAKEQAQQLGQKASGAASQAKQKAGDLLSRAEQKLDQSGALDKVRDNALPAVAVAFGIGFLLAGGDDEEQNGGHRGRKSGSMSKAKHQLKGAVMGGLSAAVAQEARSMLGMAQGKGSQGGGVLSSLLNNLQGGGGSGGGSSSQGGQSSGGGSGGSPSPYDSTRSAGTGTY